ncbi:unnamed protein product [Prorocentrum cordatum]|uniref:Uncharacterized protein n=1 Tax=Prorocentrum cordatum TaxID=2364126 RepID=A0ABN9X5M2_9DINO|nr:unnamed protein product [Polarella glacialis]
MWEATLEPNVILQRRDQRVQEWRAVAAGFGIAQGDVGREAKALRHLSFSYNAGISACENGGQWQRALALLSEICEARLEPDIIYILSYNAGISACEKGVQWQRALALVCEVNEAQLEPDAISYNAGMLACEHSGQWQQVLSLLSKAKEAGLDTDADMCTTVTNACEMGGQWQMASSVLDNLLLKFGRYFVE